MFSLGVSHMVTSHFGAGVHWLDGRQIWNGSLPWLAAGIGCWPRVQLRQLGMPPPLVLASHGMAAGFWENTPRTSDWRVPHRSYKAYDSLRSPRIASPPHSRGPGNPKGQSVFEERGPGTPLLMGGSACSCGGDLGTIYHGLPTCEVVRIKVMVIYLSNAK